SPLISACTDTAPKRSAPQPAATRYVCTVAIRVSPHSVLKHSFHGFRASSLSACGAYRASYSLPPFVSQCGLCCLMEDEKSVLLSQHLGIPCPRGAIAAPG